MVNATIMKFNCFCLIWFDVDGGACGYANLALQISQGYFAAAVPSLYKGGAGCGACYQVWIFSNI